MSALDEMLNRTFGRKTLRTLNKKGINIIDVCSLPDQSGSYLNSQTGYKLSYNGKGIIRTYLEVLDLLK